MTETKTIKINLKQFIEDLLISFSSNEEDGIKELDEKFKHFYDPLSDKMKDEVLYYVKQTKLVSENNCLTKYFSSFSM